MTCCVTALVSVNHATFAFKIHVKAYRLILKSIIFFYCFTHAIYNATLTLPTLHTLIKILTYIMLHYSA